MPQQTALRDAVFERESGLGEACATDGFKQFLDLAAGMAGMTGTAGTRSGGVHAGKLFARKNCGRWPSAD